MQRRGNSKGTVFRRKDGRWVAMLSLGEGKRRCFYLTTCREAMKALDEARGERHDEARKR